nr:MAG TPA: head tail connector [Caudoviricetes sp.]
MLAAAREYVLSYTGLTAENADQYESLAIAAMVLCADMYDNRDMTVDKANVNRTAQSILDMHSINLV